jgi:type IV secretion system protein VirB2
MGILAKMHNQMDIKNLALVAGTALAVIAASAMPALAQDLSPITTMLTNVTSALTGTLGKGIGTIAVCAVGISAFTGRMNWMFAISVLIGLVLLFGAATIIGNFGGGGTGGNTPITVTAPGGG